MLKGLLAQRLVGWFILAIFLLNFPLLLLWDHPTSWWGVPIFPLGLFCIWLLLIIGVAWIIEHTQDED